MHRRMCGRDLRKRLSKFRNALVAIESSEEQRHKCIIRNTKLPTDRVARRAVGLEASRINAARGTVGKNLDARGGNHAFFIEKCALRRAIREEMRRTVRRHSIEELQCASRKSSTRRPHLACEPVHPCGHADDARGHHREKPSLRRHREDEVERTSLKVLTQFGERAEIREWRDLACDTDLNEIAALTQGRRNLLDAAVGENRHIMSPRECREMRREEHVDGVRHSCHHCDATTVVAFGVRCWRN